MSASSMIILSAGLALAQGPGADDKKVDPTVRLEKRIQELEKDKEQTAARLQALADQLKALQEKADSQAKSLKYMQTIAESFFEAIVQHQPTSACRLLSKEALGVGEGVWQRLSNVNLDRKYTAWSVHSGELAPGSDEALFRGTLTGTKNKTPISVRVVKDKATGRYLIDFFLIPNF